MPYRLNGPCGFSLRVEGVSPARWGETLAKKPPSKPRQPKERPRQAQPKEPVVLSVPRCRTLLGATATESDLEIERLRDQLYEVVQVWLDGEATVLRSSLTEFPRLPKTDRSETEE